MIYTQTNWTETTAITPALLNKMEVGIGQATPITGQATTSASGWTSISSNPFTRKKDVAITGVTTLDTPLISFTLSSYPIALDAGITYVETTNGGITLYAINMPSGAITFDYVILKG
jgi:hypothetical protein